ncbi:MAG TPA: putative metal-binding motif-containing protein, partial [Saprospiraceae bacterium]|nr:putative metal-binding motif-containing protein [Saprospiraceae bacterium]
MKTLFLLLFFMSAIRATSQIVELEWEKSFGGTGYEVSYDLVLTPDSNIIIVGNGGPLAAEFSDCGYVILKINVDGELLWSKCYGGNNSSIPKSVINSAGGGYVIAGESYANDGDITGAHGSADFWVVKINSVGELEWQIAIGGSNYDGAMDLIQNNDGDYLIVGTSMSIDADVNDHHATEATTDLLLAKIGSSGELLWTKSYGGNYNDSGESITEDGLGNFILAGYSESSSGDVPENKGSFDFWVLKINSDGAIIWSRTFGGSEPDLGNDVEFYNGIIYVVGETYSNDYDVSGNHGAGRDGWLLKLTDDGNFVQQKCFGGSSFEELFDIAIISENEILLTGISGSNNGDLTNHYGTTSYSDFWILMTDTLGNITWQKSFGGTFGENSYGGISFFSNNFIASGFTNSSDFDVSENEGGSDMWTVKLNVCYDRYFVDFDGDEFGDVTKDSIACNMPIGYVSDSTDCNDTNPDIHPFLSDICNSIDDNCNGFTDEDAVFTTYYLDSDGDSFGDILFDSTSCNTLLGFVENSEDCNDTNTEINPLMSETCNGIDDNCNIEVDEGLTIYTLYIDADDDTYGNPDAAIDTCIESIIGYVNNGLDCNDTLTSIYPGAIELCNYLDDDCDGLTDDNLTYILSYQDNDGDEFGNPLIDSLSCELPIGYVIDNTDCNDTNAAIYPGAEELLNGIDDDCDQIADEGLSIIDLATNT